MSSRVDNLGRIVHDASGIVLGTRSNGVDTYTPAVIAQSAVPSPVTGTVAETTLASITIPGGAMGPNGALRISLAFSVTNSANNKTFRAKLGGQTFLLYTVGATNMFLAAPLIRNRGAQNVQLVQNNANAGLGAASVAPANANVDTSVDQVLTITAQLASAAETITLEAYTVEVVAGA